MNKKRINKPITVTITNPEELEQASINFTKAVQKIFMEGKYNLEDIKDDIK